MKFTSHISLCMMLALLISSSLLADQKATPVRLPIATGDLPGKELDWYGVYVKDRKNGWARIEMKKVEDGYRLDMQVHIQLKSMGQTSVMDVREVQLFDAEPPYALRALNAVQKDDRFSTTYGVKRVKAETYEATITSGKVVRKKTLSIDYTLADVLCPAIWIRRDSR